MRRMGFGAGEPGGRPDGDVRYRLDQTGRRVGILPATCKRRRHSLFLVGYDATDSDGHLRITCRGCVGERHPDHTWWLITTPPTPDSAELDDAAYRDIEPHFQVREIPRQQHGQQHSQHQIPPGTGETRHETRHEARQGRPSGGS